MRLGARSIFNTLLTIARMFFFLARRCKTVNAEMHWLSTHTQREELVYKKQLYIENPNLNEESKAILDYKQLCVRAFCVTLSPYICKQQRERKKKNFSKLNLRNRYFWFFQWNEQWCIVFALASNAHEAVITCTVSSHNINGSRLSTFSTNVYICVGKVSKRNENLLIQCRFGYGRWG